MLLGISALGRLQAQDPAAQQDAEAAREKLLKAADELDNIQANSEATKSEVDGMRADVAKLQADVTALQSENADLKQQLTATQSALDTAEAARIKDRQTLIDNVADMLAASKASPTSRAAKRKKETADSGNNEDATDHAKTSDGAAGDSSLTPPPDKVSAAPAANTSDQTASATDDAPPAPRPQKGYYHVVATGETLTLICEAYRDNGVKVTVSQIRRANGLTEKSVLKPGQKIFIPKPGT
jgi:LysM repeat protein